MSDIQTITDFLQPSYLTDKEGKTYTLSPRCLNSDNVLRIRSHLKQKQKAAAELLLSITPKDKIQQVTETLYEKMLDTYLSELNSLQDPEVIRIILSNSIEELDDQPLDDKKPTIDSIMSANSVAALCTSIIEASGEMTVKNSIRLLGQLRNKTTTSSHQPSQKSPSQNPTTSQTSSGS